ncbi:hypothetical protein L6R49_02350 [Myxococcota bacterium]|nr:hypothetical protein [Myxococcota bacterium]
MTDKLSRSLLVVTTLIGVACADGKDDATDSASGDSGATEALYTINGVAITFGVDQTPAPEGLCVEAVDPAAVFDGGAAEVVAEGVVGAGGAYTLTDVPVRELPTVVVVRDCEGAASTVYPTGSPVLPFEFQSITDGQTVTDVRSASLPNTTLAGFEAGLSAAGYTGDLPVEGFAFGAIWDASQQPIPGAQINCQGCDVYYADGDPSDGLFATGGVRNTATSGPGLWLIPAAPKAEYTITAEGYAFPSVTFAAPKGGAFFGIAIGDAS